MLCCSGGYGNGEHDGRRPQICLTRAIGRVWLTASANAHARVDVRQTTHTDADADAGTGTGRASRKSRALRTWQDESYVRKLCTHAPSAWRASASARARAASGFQVSRLRGCEVSTAEVSESGCGCLMRRPGRVGLASYIFTPVRGSWLIQHHHGSCAASELFLASEMRRAANTVYVYVCTRIPFAGGTGDGPSGSHPDSCAALDLECLAAT